MAHFEQSKKSRFSSRKREVLIRVAINGFGRIGRQVFKIIQESHKDIQVAAINDLGDNKTLAHLLKYDSNYGTWDKKVQATDKYLVVNGKKVLVLGEKEPQKLPWRKLKVDIVVESTGRFTDDKSAGLHLKAGAKRVIITAPATGSVETFVLGVNQDKLTKNHKIVSNASCTTNCISPVADVIRENFGIKKALMTTIHSYTQDQNLQDGPHKDLRRARAAAENIVPTTTGAAVATTQTIPELEGLFDGLAIRVPTPVVSLSDFTILTAQKVTVNQVNSMLEKAAKQPKYRGILAVTKEPVVSSDLKKSTYSAIVDLSLTQVVDGDLLKVVAWYDNEWGYSCRVAELIKVLAKIR